MVKKARYYTNHEFVFSIGQRIKESRKEHNHSQEYHIEKVRLSINSYEDLEKLVSKYVFIKSPRNISFIRIEPLNTSSLMNDKKSNIRSKESVKTSSPI